MFGYGCIYAVFICECGASVKESIPCHALTSAKSLLYGERVGGLSAPGDSVSSDTASGLHKGSLHFCSMRFIAYSPICLQ